jgi:ketosteroid isomerase-like protein
MSQESLEIVRRWIDDYNERGLEAVIDRYWHERIEMLDPPALPDAGRHVGHDAVRQRVESFIEMGWDGQFRVDELIESGDEVIMVWRVVGHAPAGDMPMEFDWVFVLSLEDGKLRRIRQYRSKEEALEAVGLSE